MPSSVSNSTDVIVEEELSIVVVGKYVGQCKWFNDMLGYGFVTICEGTDKGKDIFVHHSGIQPLNSNYKTLRKGEYLNFNIVKGVNGLQAVNITGINGGPLMCDFVSVTRGGKPTSTPPESNTHPSTHPTPSSNPPRRGPPTGESTFPRGPSRNPHAGGVMGSPAGPTNQRGGVMGNLGSPAGPTNQRGGVMGNLGSPWYVVTKTGRVKNLAKYSKEGRLAMKQAKEQHQH